MSFPSKFAVFRGTYNPTTGMEYTDSAMIFTSSMSSDKAYPVLSVSRWMGYIDRDNRVPEKHVRTASFHFEDATLLNQPFLRLPYSVECIIPNVGRSERMPMFAFLNTNWMPAVETLSKSILERLDRSDQCHMRHISYIATTIMKASRGENEPHMLWNLNNENPYSILKDIVITSIPFDVSPEKVCKVCNDVIRRRYEELMSPPWL